MASISFSLICLVSFFFFSKLIVLVTEQIFDPIPTNDGYFITPLIPDFWGNIVPCLPNCRVCDNETTCMECHKKYKTTSDNQKCVEDPDYDES